MIKEKLLEITPGAIIRFLARPYVAGYTMEAGLKQAETLLQTGRFSTIDLLGEEAKQESDVVTAVEIYLKLLTAVNNEPAFANLASRPTVSLKLSALVVADSSGERVKLNEEKLMKNTQAILEKARDENIEITIDMEDFRWTDLTLDVYRHFFAHGFPTLGTVIQTRLFRTAKDIETLPDNCRVRLCIGIYKEDSTIAYTEKREMKEKLLEYSRKLLEKNIYLELATHDEMVLERFFTDIVSGQGFPEGRLEVQMLLGVPRATVQNRLIEGSYYQGKKIPVRLYVPFAVHKKDSTHYSKRRLIANPDMIGYGIKNIFGQMAGKGGYS